ncbi:2,3-bisphosphoglycerate-independent phosphoglycerate mutase [archaeon]|jgi:2,3-bisphosphoglycerate-independent phosphoglycerate mutase|nr:2,3-bisphosphoglycerate-independent phosphoglycerate mutase [archaeon]MBT6868918.1 2,3-bisphosphoglycerate-independent phosphoglycerate mutase [archaeon]MBT7192861.1 2,3-bisphosphoglycerate-independent phosphoglycerate mutase [archaeon]MBT7380827.1 2,3-bisphosphoglycerate-independent phosphoglycerate mutase [archaeon]MBT7507582.1 2,3-bisphosphoglycerate-independent phosphoglycerate mutase [archaeon]
MKKRQKVALVILDGVGYSKLKESNATYRNMPFLNSLKKTSAFTLLSASGKKVGLPKGFMGNSEVGHLNIGAGRTFKQTIEKINDSIKDKSFFRNKELVNLIKKTEKLDSNLHLIGMYSEAGIHSHLDHLKALISVVKKSKIKTCYLHVVSDGRDTKPKDIKKYVKNIQKFVGENKQFKFASISGRYYAMDRDKRWSRTNLYYQTISGKIKQKDNISDLKKAINLAYKNNETDEFIKPVKINNFQGLQQDDSVIFFNFREDRMRQIVAALGNKKFNYFSRKKIKLNLLCMYEYDSSFKLPVMFKRGLLKNTLGEVISKNGLKQLRLAETEKAAHVTYFFNGGKEKPFSKEKRMIIPSPSVSTYDLKPEMSAMKIKDIYLKRSIKYNLIVVNFANGDMVGHTGKLSSAKKAITTVDNCLNEMVNYSRKNGVQLIITADHGNCELMNRNWKKTHTLNKVPFLIVDKKIKLSSGSLKNIAPTILKIMGIKKPTEMDAKTLY